MVKNTETIAVSIPLEMYQWLETDEGKRLVPNKSKIFQDSVERIKNPRERRLQPMSIFIIIMGMAFGIGSMVASFTLVFSFLFTSTLFLLGAIILLAAMVTLVKETRRVSTPRIHKQV